MTRSAILGIAIMAVNMSFAIAGPPPASCAADRAIAQCACVAAAPLNAPIGRLSDVVGDVRMSGTAGYVPVAGPASVFIGDRIIAGENGAALLSIGTCNTSIAANSTTLIRAVGGCGCVTTASDDEYEPDTNENAGSRDLFGAAAAADAFGSVLLSEEQSSPVSP